jgi:hypothetical protein
MLLNSNTILVGSDDLADQRKGPLEIKPCLVDDAGSRDRRLA